MLSDLGLSEICHNRGQHIGTESASMDFEGLGEAACFLGLAVR